MDTAPQNEPCGSTADLREHGRAASPRRKKIFWGIAGMILIIGVGIAIYLTMRSSEPLESSFAGVRGEAASKTAIIHLWNVSDHQVTFRATRLFYRYRGKEWHVSPKPPLIPLKYPSYVRPGTMVEFPVLLRTEDGDPISGPFEVGISYGTTKKTWIGSVPAGIRNALGTALGVTEGKAMRGVHWIQFVAP